VTRSGGNAFHGDLFEFLRNGDLNARDFFAVARDTLRRNQFGVNVTGPVVLPTNDAGRTQFSMAFRGADRPAANLEFELTLVDDDGVTSSRTVLVQVSEDAVPVVELAVGSESLTFTVKDTGGFQAFEARDVGTLKIDKPGRHTLTVKVLTEGVHSGDASGIVPSRFRLLRLSA